ncbi:hypothetical protein RCL_jg10902.t1 [Rhizophagus clarus]|uniref:Uncharacterized protein n=1 Tax=Rhizophagus clarus TaxID=94130 RepID=A0A8H3QI43_9GLOM|nr:hypothetical protein RCL_jg10902.t1 [Rhizophagus clarus]
MNFGLQPPGFTGNFDDNNEFFFFLDYQKPIFVFDLVGRIILTEIVTGIPNKFGVIFQLLALFKWLPGIFRI